MEQKKTFRLLLAVLAVTLLLLPFVTTFNSVLTEIINKVGAYRTMQRTLVPFESRLVLAVIRPLGIPAFLAQAGDSVSFYMQKGDQFLPVQLQWNCLGWQSMLLLGVSLIVGLQGDFSRLSKIECMVIGLLGTFLVNIFRMVFITVGVYYVNTVFAFLIHDYFAALTTIIWLGFYWWFSYGFVLEEKTN